MDTGFKPVDFVGGDTDKSVFNDISDVRTWNFNGFKPRPFYAL